MEGWIAAGAGFLGVVIGSMTTVKVQERIESEERRRHAASTIGQLKKLLDIYSPGRWWVAAGDDPQYETLSLYEKQWHDLSPELLAFPVFYPDAVELVEDIYKNMSKLTNGTWHLTRRTSDGIQSDHLEENLTTHQAELREDVDRLMRHVWTGKPKKVSLLAALSLRSQKES